MTHTKSSMIAFTNRVKDAFLAKRIKSPVHLCGGNEDALIEIFKGIKPTDWIFSNWRSAYHALLHGISEDWLFQEILEGRSMYVFNKAHNFLASSIVAGMLPIALGVAWSIKRAGRAEMVHVFCGDMTARTGLFFEFMSYADGHKLPISVIVEDNSFSTNTPTREVWGGEVFCEATNIKITRYKYKRTWPHVGVGVNVQF